MRVEILEEAVFGALNPQAIEKYLEAQNWKIFKRIEDEVSLWDNYNANGEKFRVLLPLNKSLQDFCQSMGRVVRILSVFENRSQLHILEDFSTLVIGDVVRLKSQDVLNSISGTLPIDDGVSLIQQSRDLVSAAACAAIEPKPVFPSRKPTQATDYVKKTRLAQTERGSYIIKLISPLPPKQLSLPEIKGPPPYERKVVNTLMKSLEALNSAATQVRKKGAFYFRPFQEIVSEGVSANLCEAIADPETTYRPIEISVTWSYALKSKEITPDKVSFSVGSMPYIVEAAKRFREENPEEVNLTGYITTLHREETQGDGEITLACLIDSRQCKVKIELNEQNYNIAIRAHKKGAKIFCQGTLERKGNFYILKKITDFHVLEW